MKYLLDIYLLLAAHIFCLGHFIYLSFCLDVFITSEQNFFGLTRSREIFSTPQRPILKIWNKLISLCAYCFNAWKISCLHFTVVISTVCVFDFTAVINRAHLFFAAFLPQRWWFTALVASSIPFIVFSRRWSKVFGLLHHQKKKALTSFPWSQ